MAIEAVKEYFSKYGIADQIKEFDVSSATVELAAQALISAQGAIPRITPPSTEMAGGTLYARDADSPGVHVRPDAVIHRRRGR